MATYSTRLHSSATLWKPQITKVTRLHFVIGDTTVGRPEFCLGELLARAGEEPSRAGGRIYYAGGKERSFVLLRHHSATAITAQRLIPSHLFENPTGQKLNYQLYLLRSPCQHPQTVLHSCQSSYSALFQHSLKPIRSLSRRRQYVLPKRRNI